MDGNKLFSIIEIDNKMQVVKVSNFDSKLFFGKELQFNHSIIELAGVENSQQLELLLAGVKSSRSERRNSCTVYVSNSYGVEPINVCAHIELLDNDVVRLYLTAVHDGDMFRAHLKNDLNEQYNNYDKYNEAILNSLPAAVGVCICSNDGVVKYVNDSLCRILHLQKDMVNEISQNIITDSSILDVVKDSVSRGVPIDVPFQYQMEIAKLNEAEENKERKLLYIECSGRPIINSYGEKDGYILITKDITAMVDNQEALRQSMIKAEIAMKSADVMFWEFDVEKNLFFSDNEVLNNYDRSVPIIPDQYLSLVHESDREAVTEIIERMQSGENMTFNHDFLTMLRVDGSLQNCTINGLPYKVDKQSGRVLKYVGVRKNNTELHKKKLLQDKILNSIPVSIHIKDVEDNFRYLFCNDESNRVFGTSEGQSISDVVNEESLENIKSIDYEVYASGREHTGFERIELKDGRVWDMITRRSVIEDDDKRLLLSIRWDQSLQLDLQRRSKLLTMTLEMMNAFTWFYRPDKDRLTFGGGFEKLSRRESEINTIDTYIESIHPDDRDRCWSTLQATLNKEQSIWDVEYRIDLNEDGHYQWVQSRGLAETTIINNQPSTYMFGMTISIEAHKQSELNLLKTKEDLSRLIQQNELILNNSNSGFAYITNDYMVKLENISTCAASLSFEAYKRGEYCYKSAHNRTTPCENCVLQRVKESRQMEQIQFELENKRKIEIFATPVFDEKHEIDGIVIRLDDITERERMIEELRHAKMLAEQSDKLKSAFLANMSHEIRTPLNSIVGFSDLLISNPDDEDREEYANIIKNNNELLLKLINDILDLSKIEAGSIEFKYEEFDLSEYFDSVAGSMNRRITNNNVQMVVVNPYEFCSVYLDKNRVAQIMINYLTNAIKYTYEGFIEMGYECVEGGVRFYVNDSGIGISDDKQGRVFHRFAKLDEFAQGTGLGLSICKATAETMGGRVGFESKYGEGSNFWVFLPCNPKIGLAESTVKLDSGHEIVDETALNGENGSSPNEQKTILVAEDIYSNYLLISTMLKNRYNLVRAEDGCQAVGYVANNHVDLVLMDMKMPVLDGIKATVEIRSFNKRLPIVALTAHAFESDRLAALEAGCNDFLVKPLDKIRLNEVLSKYLNE